MIVLSNSFPKSASTLLFVCTQDLIMAASELNGQETLRRWIEEGRIDGLGDRYVRYLDFRTTKVLLKINR